MLSVRNGNNSETTNSYKVFEVDKQLAGYLYEVLADAKLPLRQSSNRINLNRIMNLG